MPLTTSVNGNTGQYKNDSPTSTKHHHLPNGKPGSPKKKRTYVAMTESDDDEPARPKKHLHSNGVNGSPMKAKKKMKETEKFAALQEQRAQLPIAKGRDALLEQIRDNDTVIILGETGSGKTTQLPQYIYESQLAGDKIIAVTQPRRVAATSLAARVAAEQQTHVGGVVGYAVRFDEASSSETRIKYMTDGMLVRELLSDPLLSRYNVIVVDEAHERTLRTDVVLLKLKGIQQERRKPVDRKGKRKELEPLKVVIMSATLDAEKFSQYFNGAKILYVKGRQHPVTIYHTATSQLDYVDSALRTFFQIHTDSPSGDVLIFLPGQEDIESLEKSIHSFSDKLPDSCMKVLVCPMFAALPPNQQGRVFGSTPPNTRKCILATNIAETSITIPGIKFVIDTGKCKEKTYIAGNTGNGLDTLLTRDITQSSALQRAGRAGREGPGQCFRLYTEADFETMDRTAKPEIQRCSLTSSALHLRCMDMNIEDQDFMDKPDRDSVVSALKTLFTVQAIDASKTLTALGKRMALFPLEPPAARSVLAAIEFGCTKEVLDIVAVLSSSSKLFYDISEMREEAADARKKFQHTSGDHLTLLNAFRAYEELVADEGMSKAQKKIWCRQNYLNDRTLIEAVAIREQLRMSCERLDIDWRVSCGDADEPVLKSLLRGHAQNTAQRHPDGTYKQLMGLSVVKIHPSSTVVASERVPVIMYDELVFTTQKYARTVSVLSRSFFTDVMAFNLKTIS